MGELLRPSAIRITHGVLGQDDLFFASDTTPYDKRLFIRRFGEGHHYAGNEPILAKGTTLGELILDMIQQGLPPVLPNDPRYRETQKIMSLYKTGTELIQLVSRCSTCNLPRGIFFKTFKKEWEQDPDKINFYIDGMRGEFKFHNALEHDGDARLLSLLKIEFLAE